MPIPLIVAGIGAAASLGGAKLASNASKNAAQAQVTAADKAQQFNQQVYDDSKTRLNPYVQAGTNSLAALQARYGASDPAALASRANAFTNAARYGGPSSFGPGPTQAQYNAGPMQQPGGGGMPERGPELPPAGGAPPMSLAAMQAGGGQAPQLVRVQAPTGEIQMMPMAMAQQAQAKGARILQ